jgi:hypothetical protein
LAAECVPRRFERSPLVQRWLPLPKLGVAGVKSARLAKVSLLVGFQSLPLLLNGRLDSGLERVHA